MTERRARALLALAEASLDLGSDERPQAERALREAADEIVPAIEWLFERDVTAALRLVGALSFFWQDTGRLDEGRDTTESVLARSRGHDARARAGAHLVASELAFRQGDQPQATRHADTTIALAESVADRPTAAMAHLILARVAFRDADAARIERHAERATLLAPDDPWVRRGAVHMTAWAAQTAGDRSLARRRFAASMELRTSQGDRFGAAVEQAIVGDLAAADGDLAEAGRCLRDALLVGVELPSQYLILNLLPSFAALAARAGQDEPAVRLMGAAERLSEATALEPDPGTWQPVLDDVASRLGPRYDVLLAEGRALSDDATTALALEVAELVEGAAVVGASSVDGA